MQRVPSAAGYGVDAEEIARRYEGVAFEVVHEEFLPWLPPVPGRVVDIGAGSGRDAAALAARGHQVVAVGSPHHSCGGSGSACTRTRRSAGSTMPFPR
ncbi:hypothetical protein GCM10010376_64170 [Streptomyces violaceusniger]